MFDTEYKRIKYFKDIGLYIVPTSYVIGECIETKV